MWQCIGTGAVSCVCGAGSGEDGPERTVETNDVDQVELLSHCEAGSDLMLAKESSVWCPLPPVIG